MQQIVVILRQHQPLDRGSVQSNLDSAVHIRTVLRARQQQRPQRHNRRLSGAPRARRIFLRRNIGQRLPNWTRSLAPFQQRLQRKACCLDGRTVAASEYRGLFRRPP